MNSFVHIRRIYDEFETSNSFFPCISVHIRRGDKQNVNMDNIAATPTIDYVNKVVALSASLSRKRSILLLADEDPVALEFISLVDGRFPVFRLNTSESRYAEHEISNKKGILILCNELSSGT